MAGYTIVNLMELENRAQEGDATTEPDGADRARVGAHRAQPVRTRRAGAAPMAMPTASRRRSTSCSAARAGEARRRARDLRQWDVVAWPRDVSAASQAGRTGSSCSRSAPTGPRAATASAPTRAGGATESSARRAPQPPRRAPGTARPAASEDDVSRRRRRRTGSSHLRGRRRVAVPVEARPRDSRPGGRSRFRRGSTGCGRKPRHGIRSGVLDRPVGGTPRLQAVSSCGHGKRTAVAGLPNA